MSNIVQIDDLKKQASDLIKSGFLPAHIKTEAQFTAIALKGLEVGMKPMQSISMINVIQGKPCISSEGMLSLVFKNVPTASIVYLSLLNTECVIKARRDRDSEYSTFSFSMEDAKLAGIHTKDNWRKYPRAMLKARCIAEMCRSLFPDAIAGISYTPEELNGQEDHHEVLIPKTIQEKDPNFGEEPTLPLELDPPKKVIPNRAEEATKNSAKVIRYGTKFSGMKFTDVPIATLTMMYEHAKKNLQETMAKAYIRDYEDFVKIMNNQE